MAKATDIVNRWKQPNGIRPLERNTDVLKVLRHYDFEIRWGSENHLVASHKNLKRIEYNQLGMGNEFSIALVKGKEVKSYYVKILMKYIGLLETFHGY
jgi:hypothetical protein